MQSSQTASFKRGREERRYSRGLVLYSIASVLFFLTLIIWASFSFGQPSPVCYQQMVFPWVVLSLLFLFFGFFAIKKVPYYDIALWFVVLSYLFMFGHVFTYVFDMQTTLVWDPSIYFTEQEKHDAAIYALVAVYTLGMGALIVAPCSAGDEGDVTESDKTNSIVMRNVGIACFAIGLACNLINSSEIVSATQASGSYASYTSANTSGIFDDLGFLVVPGFAFLVFSKTLKRSTESAILVVAVSYFLATMVLSGSRKYAIFAIVALLLAFLNSRKRSSLGFWKSLSLIALGVAFLNLLYVIRESRFDLVSVLPEYIDSLLSMDFIGSILGETLTETGLTFYAAVGIVSTVPSVFPYECGLTFLKALPSFLPIGWLIGDILNSASSTYVINSFLGVPVGASLLGDFYWNWGFAGGVVASFVFGAILTRTRVLLTKKERLMPLCFACLYVVLIGVRSGFAEILRPLIIVLVLPILLYALFDHYSRRYVR